MSKVKFLFYNEVLERDEVESLWANIIDGEKGFYRLDNIPFFVKNYASDDIVHAELIDDELVVTGLIEGSGNSTINIIFFNDKIKDDLLKRISELGAEYEGLEKVIKGYYTVNVPKSVDYMPIYTLLKELEDKEELSFREASLEHKT